VIASLPTLTAAWRRQVRGVLAGLGLVIAGAAFGQGLQATGPIAWGSLSPAQRSVLAPLERDWKAISPGQQQKWAEVANRFPAMPADDRSRVQQRLSDWSRLSSQERAAARLNFQEARQLSPQERQQQWEAYRALPADQRRALAEQSNRARPAVPLDPRSGTAGGAAASKSNSLKTPSTLTPQPVGPTVVQRGAGATTNLVSKPTTPPLHQQAGLPKVAATPGFVDSKTLLPKRGAQGAAAARAPDVDDESKRNPQ
jgi:hypothetical protein